MKDRHADDWEELAQREPYYAVLTSDEFLGATGGSEASAAFFATGEADIAALLANVTSLVGHAPSLSRVLDYGCGVGRLSLPLARRASRVIGCDIAPTMLAHARENAARAGLQNVEFIDAHRIDSLQKETFDFICSLMVLQHIPTSSGYAIIRSLVALLAPGGIAALHVSVARSGGRLRRIARTLRARSPLLHKIIGVLRRDPLRLPYMQMNEYDVERIRGDVEASGARILGRFARVEGDVAAAVLVIQRQSH